MRSTSLQDKTARTGLMNYSFYSSSRQPIARAPAGRTPLNVQLPEVKPGRYLWPALVILAIIVGAILGYKSIGNPPASGTGGVPTTSKAAPAVGATAPNRCAGNTQLKLMEVSISARHLWACQGAKPVYDTAVVTGMENYAADKTPLGTYTIYDKQTNLTLIGSDSTGSWSDPVSYWMPFLNNQYGTFGLHDATWRSSSDFGNISPSSNNASHGCVELPLAAAQWLYNWAQVGTQVTIKA